MNGHDLPSPEVPRAYPYGIYDLERNTGFVNVGTDHDTGAFAVASVRGWWRSEGRALYSLAILAKDAVNPETIIPPNAKVFVAPMDGFGAYVIAAIHTKKTPVLVVAKKDKADYIIDGASESTKVGWARTVFMGQAGTDEEASITCTNVKTGVVVYAYNVNKKGSARGKQSAGEAIAVHIEVRDSFEVQSRARLNRILRQSDSR